MFSYYAAYFYKYVNFYLMLKDIFFIAKQNPGLILLVIMGLYFKIKEWAGALCNCLYIWSIKDLYNHKITGVFLKAEVTLKMINLRSLV